MVEKLVVWTVVYLAVPMVAWLAVHLVAETGEMRAERLAALMADCSVDRWVATKVELMAVELVAELVA